VQQFSVWLSDTFSEPEACNHCHSSWRTARLFTARDRRRHGQSTFSDLVFLRRQCDDVSISKHRHNKKWRRHSVGLRVFHAFALAALVVCSTAVTRARAQAPSNSPFQLRVIQVTGQHRYTAAEVTKVSGLEAGKPVSVTELNAAADRMAATGLFQHVKYRYTTTGRDMTVTLEVAEAEWTIPVVLDNFIWMPDEEIFSAIQQDVPSFDGTAPTLAGASDLIEGALQKLLKSRNIQGRVEFSPQLDQKTNKLQYLFSVKDPSPKICTITVEGQSAVVERQLVEALGASVGDDYSRFYITAASNGTLIDLYRQRGYWRATFAPPSAAATTTTGCAGAKVTLRVSEGPTYGWDRAAWTGNAALAATNLDALLGMKAGDVADASKIGAGLLAIRKAYSTHGYIMEAHSYKPVLDDASRRAAFEFAISEGPQFHAGPVAFAGLSDAETETLRKKWRLKPGDVYDDSYVRKFQTEETMHRQRGTNQSPRPAKLEADVDDANHIVNVRFVFE
jgi:outer membrane protein assembly factor BamA